MSAAAGTKYSLVVEGGTLVIPGVGLVNADVGIRDGKIVALGNDLAGRTEEFSMRAGKRCCPASSILTCISEMSARSRKKRKAKRVPPCSAA